MSQLVHPSTGRRATNIEDSRDIETCPNLCAAHCKGTDLSLTRKGLASHCKAEATFTFHSSILTLLNAFKSTNNREMKSESGFSFAMANQPFQC